MPPPLHVKKYDKRKDSFDKIYFMLSILLDYYQNTNGNLAHLLLLLYN